MFYLNKNKKSRWPQAARFWDNPSWIDTPPGSMTWWKLKNNLRRRHGKITSTPQSKIHSHLPIQICIIQKQLDFDLKYTSGPGGSKADHIEWYRGALFLNVYNLVWQNRKQKSNQLVVLSLTERLLFSVCPNLSYFYSRGHL